MARVIAIPLLFLSLVVLGRGAAWLLAAPAVEQVAQQSGTGSDESASAVRSGGQGQWVRTKESAAAQDAAINRNLANGDPMMNGDPVGEAVEQEVTVNGVTTLHRRQQTGLVSRIEDGEEKKFGDPGYVGQ